MAFTFDSTLKGGSSNSYVSISEADDYFDGHPKSGLWSNLTITEKQQFLVHATQRLDVEQYGGETTDSSQMLQWPRLWVVARNYDQSSDYIEFVNGEYYRDSETQPRELKISTFEMSLWFIEEYKEQSSLFSRNDIDRMESVEIGPLKASLRNVKEDKLPDRVVRLLKAIGPNGWMGGRMIKLVR